MAFKLFEEYGSASRDAVSLRASGAVFMPNAILSKSNVEKPVAAKLYYDADEKKIGIQLLDTYTRSDRIIRKLNDEKSGQSINITPLMRFYGLTQPDKKMSMSAKVNDDMVIIDAAEIAPSRRGRKPKVEVED